MQFLHSASAMADTDMEKKDFARRKTKNVAQNAVAQTHFSVAQNQISVAQSRVDIYFLRDDRNYSSHKIPSREYNPASRKV